MNRRWRHSAWIVLVTLLVSSCSTYMNVRPEDYGRIEPGGTYRIVTVDGHEYDARNLAVTDSVATFTLKDEKKSVPVASIRQIQEVNHHAILKTTLGVGAVLALTVGLVVLLKPD